MRRRRKYLGTSTAPQVKADGPNTVWGVDFQFDADETGKALKIVSIVDEFTRECVGGMVERSITAPVLREHLDAAPAAHGVYPAVLRSDNGSEFISKVMEKWAGEHTGLAYIPPGQPWRNGYVESFNSRIRDECLNINSFYSLTHARHVIGEWKHQYNTTRKHSALGYQTPAEYAATCTNRKKS